VLGDTRGPRARDVRILEAHNPHAETYADVVITCSECRRSFSWCASEQQFYREHRLFPPKKCGQCRVIVRARLGLPIANRPWSEGDHQNDGFGKLSSDVTT
jgi:hypothetical protein